MSLVTQLTTAFTRVGTEFKTIRSEITALVGAKGSLTTTDKTTIVAAINEVKAGQASAGAQINDTTPGSGTVYSSTKTDAQIAAVRASLKSELLGGAVAAYDTLLEIKDYVDSVDGVNDSTIAGLTTAVGNRVRFDAAQGLTTPQQLQARNNIGAQEAALVGDTTTDFSAQFVSALA